MPIYDFVCNWCGFETSEVRPMSESGYPAPQCLDHGPMRRNYQKQSAAVATTFTEPILSTRMGVDASQVAEHRKLHPNIPMNDQGEIIVASMAEEKRIDKVLKIAFEGGKLLKGGELHNTPVR